MDAALETSEAPLPPHQGHRIAIFDGYRAIAALLVVATHVSYGTGFVLSRPFGAVAARFDIGVSIFFVLSGYLLYRAWAKSGLNGTAAPAVQPYLKRRMWRILPAYWVVVIAVFLFMPGLHPSVGQSLANIALVQNYGNDLQLAGLTQTWSVAVELTFYLALPVIGWIAIRRFKGDVRNSMRRQLIVIGLCWLIGLVFTIMRTSGPLSANFGSGFWLPSNLDWFAVGMFAGLAQVRLTLPDPHRALVVLQKFARETATVLVITAALFVVLTTPIAGPYTLLGADAFGGVIHHEFYPLIAFLFLLPGFLASSQRTLWHRFLCHPAMRFLGVISYGIFLWHLLVQGVLVWAFHVEPFTGGFYWLFPLTVLVTIPLAWLSWVLIERPGIARSKRLSSKRPKTKPSIAEIDKASSAPTQVG